MKFVTYLSLFLAATQAIRLVGDDTPKGTPMVSKTAHDKTLETSLKVVAE